MSKFTDFLTNQGLGAVGDTGKFALNQETKDKLKVKGKDLLGKAKTAATAAGLAQATYKGEKNLIDKQKELSTQNLNKYGGLAKNLEDQITSGQFDSDAVAKAASDRISVAEAGKESAIEQAQKGRGDVVSALRSGDPRAMAMAPSLIEGTQSAVDAASSQAAQSKAMAGADLAQYDARQKDKQLNFADKKFDTYKGLELGSEQDLQQAQMDETQLKTNRMLDAASNYQALNQQKKANEAVEESDNTDLSTDVETPAAPVPVPQPEDNSAAEELKNSLIEKEGDVNSLLEGLSGFGMKHGGKYMGEQGFVTEGEFDHSTNKKAVIDEEDGTKEAELTGGEFVFNPKQTSSIESFVEKGDDKGLLKFMRSLLKKPQFQK